MAVSSYPSVRPGMSAWPPPPAPPGHPAPYPEAARAARGDAPNFVGYREGRAYTSGPSSVAAAPQGLGLAAASRGSGALPLSWSTRCISFKLSMKSDFWDRGI